MYFMAGKSRENVPFCDVFIKKYLKDSTFTAAIKTDAKSVKLGQYMKGKFHFSIGGVRFLSSGLLK